MMVEFVNTNISCSHKNEYFIPVIGSGHGGTRFASKGIKGVWDSLLEVLIC